MSGNYVYASAKIRALEPAILDQTDIERMVDAPDFDAAYKVLNDTDYADNLLEINPSEYRKALSADFGQLYELLQTIVPDSNLFRLIILERDLVNIKLIFKAKYFEVKVDEMLKENTVYSPAHLKEFILNKKDIGLDQDIKDLISECEKEIGEEGKPDVIDSVLTKKYFELKLSLAKKVRSNLITSVIKTEIDNANLIIWLRAKRLEIDKSNLDEKFIPGGNIDKSNLIKLYSEDLKSLRPTINTYYDQKVVEGLDEYAEKNLLFEFEKELRDYVVRLAQATKLISDGPEVVYAYYLAKQNAVNNIRIILTGKFNKIPSEEIKRTLRLVR